MSQSSPAQHSPQPAQPPLIPFIVWSLAVLAYPACLLVGIVGDGVLLVPALRALPTFMAQGVLRLHTVLASAALWAVATGAGMAILRRAGYDGLTLAERAVFGAGLGMGVYSLATFVLGTVSGQPPWLLPVLCWGLVLAMAWLGARDLWAALAEGARGINAWRRQASRYSILIVALGAAIVFVALTRVNVPVFADYDSLEYHLASPARWWGEGRVTFLRDMVYSNFPQNTEMLFLLAMNCFGGPSAGAVVGMQALVGFVLLAAAAVATCGRRLGSAEAGRAGAAILLTTPLLAELATLNSYVTELPLTAYGFLALFAFLLWRRAASGSHLHLAHSRHVRNEDVTPGSWRYAALCGAMSGLAVGCKYPALVFVLAPIGAFIIGCGVARLRMLWRAVRSAALVGAVALAVASPWLIRNAANTGNPTYPLLSEVFGGWNWTPEQEAKFSAAHRASDLRFFSLARRFWSYAVWRDQPPDRWVPPASPILLLFALVPIALGDRRSARPIFYAATLFLLAVAASRFAPDALSRTPELQTACDVLLSVSILALATAPAFLVSAGDAVFLPVHGVLCLMAWHVLTHRLDRFLDPVSPGIALLGGIGLAALGTGLARRIGRGILAGGLAYALVTTILIHSPAVWPFGGLTDPPATFLRAVNDQLGSTYSHAATEAINKLPDDATVLFVGESRTFYCRRRCLAASVFDRHPIERLLEQCPPGEPASRVHRGLRELGVTHLYVNWPEVSRLAGSYRYYFDGREHKGLSPELYGNLLSAMAREGYLQPIGVFGTDPQGGPRPDFVLFALRAAP